MRFLPRFVWHTLRSLRQVRQAPGFLHGGLLPDRSWTFWTMTAWESQNHVRHYMTTGDHKTAMPHLLDWCDEASVAHWNQEAVELPSWHDADRRMRAGGRPSKVRHPSPRHAVLDYREPKGAARGAVIRLSPRS